jgi:hypothetical protein
VRVEEVTAGPPSIVVALVAEKGLRHRASDLGLPNDTSFSVGEEAFPRPEVRGPRPGPHPASAATAWARATSYGGHRPPAAIGLARRRVQVRRREPPADERPLLAQR